MFTFYELRITERDSTNFRITVLHKTHVKNNSDSKIFNIIWAVV